MGQKSQPVSDVADGGWFPEPVYAQVNDPYPGDDTFVSSFGTWGGDAFTVAMAEIGPPVAGSQKLTVRIRAMPGCGAGEATVWVTLLAEGSLVAVRKYKSIGGSFADYVMTLAAKEISLIKSYADLQVRVTAVRDSSSGAGCPCGPGVPTALQFRATFDPLHDGTCTGCAAFSCVLTNSPPFDVCVWISESFYDPCTTVTAGGNLFYDDSLDAMVLIVGVVSAPDHTFYARYVIARCDFKCNGVNVLKLKMRESGCVWPPTMTLTPI